MNFNAITPIGLHVAGVIRFASEGQGEDFKQLDQFEVLDRCHESAEPGEWPNLIRHPLHKTLLNASRAEGEAQRKLQRIPVRLVFDNVDSNLSARYEAFDNGLNRLTCVGDGTHCSRGDSGGGATSRGACVGPDACDYAHSDGVRCEMRVRLNVQIDGQEDPLSVFEVQSSGIHTYRAFAAKLVTLHALLGGLRHVPLDLVMFTKSSPAYDFKHFYVADLALSAGSDLAAAKTARNEGAVVDANAGLDFAGLEAKMASLRADRALSLVDAEAGIVTYNPAHRLRERPARRAQTPLPSGSQSLAGVIQSVKAGCALDAVAESPGAEQIVVPGIQSEFGAAGTATCLSKHVGPVSSDSGTGTIGGTAELPPTVI